MGRYGTPLVTRPRTVAATVATMLGAAVLAGMLGWHLYTEPDRAAQTAPADRGRSAPPAGLAEAAVVDGDGPVAVQVWVDLDCADCRKLVTELDATLGRLVAEQRITRIYHPVARQPESLRLAASVACAADRGGHPPYLAALLTRTAAGDGEPLTDDELVYLAGTTGLIDPAFAQCVRARRHLEWARQVVHRAAAEQVVSLPMVRVDRTVVDVSTGDVAESTAAIGYAVEAAGAG